MAFHYGGRDSSVLSCLHVAFLGSLGALFLIILVLVDLFEAEDLFGEPLSSDAFAERFVNARL